MDALEGVNSFFAAFYNVFMIYFEAKHALHVHKDIHKNKKQKQIDIQQIPKLQWLWRSKQQISQKTAIV